MLFSRSWLAGYADLPESAEELAERLTLAGFNVEGIERRAEDVVLDVDVTTNRPDCMNHLGLAREIAALFRCELRPPAIAAAPAAPLGLAAVEVDSFADCPRYAARAVAGVRVGPSPSWLAARLAAIGLRPINNIVDVTNYVLFELGQPLHAFDLDRLARARVVVRRAGEGEALVTLDGEERRLDAEVLVIADARRAVALAGIMGGRATEVSASTVNVLLESAHFDRALVRRAAKRLGMHTDASHRFERGTDPEICLEAATRAAELIVQVAGGEVAAGAVDRRPPQGPARLWGRASLARLSTLAGTPLSPAAVERPLAALGFGVRRLAEGEWEIEIPSWRRYDFLPARPDGHAYEADLCEEVLRIHGYDRVPSRLPALAGTDSGTCEAHRQRYRVKRHLAACGFAEAMNYAFQAAAADEAFPMPAEGAPVALANPLSERLAVMRRSLVPGLVESARFNLRRGAASVRLFEVGSAFFAGGPVLPPREVELVALAAGGTLGSPWERTRDLDLFDLKGAVESLGAAFGVAFRFAPAALQGAVAGTAAEIRAGDGESRAVGWLGRVNDPQLRFPLFVAQVEAAALAQPAADRLVELPSRFPAVEADLTLTHSAGVRWAEIEQAIREIAPADLAAFGLKDRYRGEGVPGEAVNTTIFFVFNASDRSLTQEEVNLRHGALARELGRRFGWPERPERTADRPEER